MAMRRENLLSTIIYHIINAILVHLHRKYQRNLNDLLTHQGLGGQNPKDDHSRKTNYASPMLTSLLNLEKVCGDPLEGTGREFLRNLSIQVAGRLSAQ